MSVLELLGQLRDAGVHLSVDAGKLKVKAPQGALTEALKEALRESRDAIIAFLQDVTPAKGSDAFPPADRAQPLPLSYMQQGVWFVEQLAPGTAAYTMPFGFIVHGNFNTTHLRHAIDRVMVRHEALKSSFVVQESGQPAVVIDHDAVAPLDLEMLSSDVDVTAVARACVTRMAMTCFSLERAPLLRFAVASSPESDNKAAWHVVTGAMHHIISDGWSLNVLVRELLAFYVEASTGMQMPLPALPIQYVDFAAWQQRYLQTEQYARKLAYWVESLRGAPPLLALPTDRPRPLVQGNRGARYGFSLDPATLSQLPGFCREREVTPFIALMTAWQALLSRVAQQNDFCVGIPTAGRHHREVENLIGFFVDPMVIRARLSPAMTFEELLGQVRTHMLSAYEHQEVPLAHILDALQLARNPAYPPLAQVGFQLQNFSGVMTQGAGESAVLEQVSRLVNLRIERIDIEDVASKFDMILSVTQENDTFTGYVEYNADLFEHDSIARLITQWQVMIKALIREPGVRVRNVPLISENELRQALSIEPQQQIRHVTDTQKLLFLDGIIKPESVQNSVGFSIEFSFQVDPVLLNTAVNHCINVYSVHRSRFVQCDIPWAENVYAIVDPTVETVLEVVDARQLDESTYQAEFDRWMHCAYDVVSGPLFGFRWYQRGAGSVIAGRFHHLVFDGMSAVLWIEKIRELYHCLSRGEPLPTWEDRFPRYIEHRRQTVDAHATQAFWHQQLKEVAPLSFSRVPGAAVSAPFEVRSLSLGRELSDAFDATCKREGVRVADVLRVFSRLLVLQYCRPEAPFLFNEIHHGRTDVADDTLSVYYQMLPTIVRREELQPAMTVRQAVDAIVAYRQRTKDVRDYSIMAMLSELEHSPVSFQFNYMNFTRFSAWDAGPIIGVLHSPYVERTLQVILKDSTDGHLLQTWCDRTVFDDLHFLERLQALVAQWVEGQMPCLAQARWVLPDETQCVQHLVSSHSTVEDDTILQAWGRSLSAHAERTAVRCGVRALLFSDVERLSNRIARALQARDIGRGDRVAVLLSRRVEWPAALLGILKSGASYVPVEASYPCDRIHHIVHDSAAKLVITEACQRSKLPEGDVLDLDEETAQLQAMPDHPIPLIPRGDDEIYVIYTSGSTGLPKGASVLHRGEVNLQQWYLATLGLGPDDVTLIISAFGFDLTQKNLFAPLLSGGTLVIPDFDGYDDAGVIRLVREQGVTLINCAPSAFYPMVSDERSFTEVSSLRWIVLGGEPIRMQSILPWLQHSSCRAQLMNSYGPTECTDVVAYHVAAALDDSVQGLPIGLPVPGCTLHVRDDDMRPVPPGLVGELCVGGIQVGGGYLNRAELTATSFIEDPYGAGRLYRTGDLCRVMQDGTLEYIGRKDFQVKIRGLRIELGEIERALRDIPALDDALVVVHDETLVAYVISQASVDTAEVRDLLRRRLPDYMVPASICVLAAWPLTPNGKIDRRALPSPSSAVERLDQGMPPRDETEARIAQIWADVLKRDRVGVRDNFFDLGGHSLLATQVVSRIRKAFAIELNLRSLMGEPTVEALADIVKRSLGTVSQDAIPRADRHGRIPLSPAQSRLWLLDRLDPGNPAYNVPVAVQLSGRLHVDAFQQAVSDTLNRHEALRTRIPEDAGGAHQEFLPVGRWPLEMRRVQRRTDDEAFDVQQAVAAVLSTRFDLAAGPLFRSCLFEVSEQRWVYVFVAHHIITDGWSMGLILRDVVASYQAYTMGVPRPGTGQALQFADVASWQQQQLEQHREPLRRWWADTLADVPVLELPADHPRPARQTFNGRRITRTLNAGISARIDSLARERGTTPFAVLLALYAAVIARYSNQDDFAIGVPVAGRDRMELEDVVGFFVNTVAVRVRPAGDLSLLDLLAETSARLSAAVEHQQLPFEEVIEAVDPPRDMSRSPIFQTLVVYQNLPTDSTQAAGDTSLHVEPFVFEVETAKFDITVTMARQDASYAISVSYNTDLFSAGSVDGLCDGWMQLCRHWIETPQSSLASLSTHTADESHWLLETVNATVRPRDPQVSVLSACLNAIEGHSNQVAVRCGHDSLTFHELGVMSERVAAALVARNVRPGDRVGVCFNRSLHLMTALLGVIRAGAVYVPIDASYPVGRIAHMVANSAMSWVVCADGVGVELPADVQRIDMSTLLNADASPVSLKVDARELLYIIYTSGSTGVPKGASVTHASEVNLLEWYCGHFGMGSGDRVLLMSAIGFDLTQKNLWGAFIAGATLVIPEFQEYDPEALAALIARERVTWINAAPSAFYPLVEGFSDALASLRWVFLGGEPIQLQRVLGWYRQTEACLVNSYGPTECTDIASYHVVARDHDPRVRVPIGKPNDNVELYVVGRHLELLPRGAAGELCIGGLGVGPGYFRDPERTSAVFVPHPFKPGERLYRTGDLVRRLPDGAIDYLGRIDQQVKLRGYRIELGEIEAVLASHADVKAAHAALHQDPRGPVLAAWVVPVSPASDNLVSDLREHAAKFLPSFMQPSAYALLETFPLTPNGKIDRKALPAPDRESVSQMPLNTESERTVARIWGEVLHCELPGADAEFFRLGGNSLLATAIIARVNQAFSAHVSVRAVFEFPVLRDFCAHLDTLEHGISYPPLVAAPMTGSLPLAHGQTRLWYFEQMNPGTCVNNMPGALLISGPFDLGALRYALARVLERHLILQCAFRAQDDLSPAMTLVPEVNVPVAVHDEQAHSPEARRAIVARFLEIETQRPFDLGAPPLMRATAVRFPDSDVGHEHAIIFCMHHIVSDGVSMAVFFRELMFYYRVRVHREWAVLPDVRIQYPDFARWQRQWMQGDVLEKQLQYWERTLQGAPDLNGIPPERPRPAVQGTHGDVVHFSVAPECVQRLEQWAIERKTTPFVVTLAVWNVLVSRYLHRADVAVGIPTSGRTHPDLEPLIGFFVNSLVVRTQWPQNSTLEGVVEATRLRVLEAFAHGDVPIDILLERLPIRRSVSHTPLVQNAFQLFSEQESAALEANFAGVHVEMVQAKRSTANFDTTLSLRHVRGGLHGALEYNTDLFERDTVERIGRQFAHVLAALLDDPAQPVDTVPLLDGAELQHMLRPGAPAGERLHPLTAMQRDMFMDSLMNPVSLQNSHGWHFEIQGDFDPDAWERSLTAYFDHFAMARARFIPSGLSWADPGYLCIPAQAALDFSRVDRSASSVAEIEAEIRAFIYRPYDVIHAPLSRFMIIQRGHSHWWVVGAVHHALFDGIGMRNSFALPVAYYNALRAGVAYAFPEDVSLEYTHDDRRRLDNAATVTFWQQRLSTVEPLDVAPVRSHAPAPTACWEERRVDVGHLDEIRRFCRQLRITPALYFKCLYAILIRLHCRPTADFVIMDTWSARPQRHDAQPGCYIQEIPFVVSAASLEPSRPVSGVFTEAREFQRVIKDHRNLSLARMNQLAPRGRVGFMYNFYQFMPQRFTFDGHETAMPEGLPSDPAGNVQFIVKLVGDDLRLCLFRHPSLFDDCEFLARIEHVSRQVVQGAETFDALNWLLPHEASKVFGPWNATAREFDLDTPIHVRVSRQAVLTPAALAIVDDREALDYARLERDSNRWAHRLIAHGIGPGDHVGVFIDRSCRFLVAVLAVLKSGAAYVPMDVKYPPERIRYMRDNAQARVVLTEEAWVAPLGTSPGCEVWPFESMREDEWPNHGPDVAVSGSDVAYLLYTSGSTGLPKGALIRHDGAMNHIEAERHVLNFAGAFNFLQTAPASSDISVWQFLGPVTCGGAVVVLDDVTQADKLFGLIRRYGVNLVELVPVAWQLLMEHVRSRAPEDRALPSLKWLMATGEAVPVPMLNDWLDLYPDIPVVNAYGPTEAADDVVQNTVRAPLPVTVRSVPIGHPLPNMNVVLVDDVLRAVPPGIPGEICISGVGVGNGYFNNPEKTAAAFLPNPFSSLLGKTLYRTGDLGRWLEDGTVEYLDRVDNQVKIRGFRIELGEIEAVLAAHPSVAEAAVVVRHDMPGGAALVGYIVWRSGAEGTVSAVRASMRERLPEYMVPAIVMALPAFPTTPAGKVDRKAMPRPAEQEDSDYTAPHEGLESRIAAAFSAVLGLDRISATRAFFDAGGNSLMAVRLVTRLNRELDVRLSVADVLRHSTVRALATRLHSGEAVSAGPLVLMQEGEGPVTVFVHPVGGDVLCYRDLAAALTPAAQYGLRHPGLDEGEAVPDVASLLPIYIRAMEGLAGRPLRFIGQSLGGVLALHLAARWSAAGGEVNGVVLVDTFLPEAMVTVPAELLPRALGLHLPEALLQTLDFSGEAWIDRLWTQWTAAAGTPPEVDLATVKRVYRVARSLETGVSGQRLPAIAAPVLHVRALDNGRDAAQGWTDAAYPFRFAAQAGDHESVMRGEQAKGLAALIDEFWIETGNR